MRQNKLISATKPAKLASVANKYDRSWKDLNHQSDDIVCITPFAPKPAAKAKRGLLRRTLRAAWLWATTKYRLSTAWAVAGV